MTINETNEEIHLTLSVIKNNTDQYKFVLETIGSKPAVSPNRC
jgi:hypothetical protein